MGGTVNMMAPTPVLETATISSDYSDDEEDGGNTCNTGFYDCKSVEC
jgi:hypothetical protein